MNNWIVYGRFQDVDYREQQGKVLDFLVIFSLFSIALIHVFNYYYQKKYPYSLIFSVFSAIYGLMVMFTGRVMASYLIPEMQAGLVFRIEALLTVFFFTTLNGLYPCALSG